VREWDLVAVGPSGDAVRRSPDGSTYSKTAHGATRCAALRAARDRTAWLSTTGVPCAAVVDWLESRDTATLVTTTVPGMPVSDVPRQRSAAATDALVKVLAMLHVLPVSDCPFDARVPMMLAAARARVQGGLVDAEDFDEERQGLTSEQALHLLEQHAPRAAASEQPDLAVCHGDFCLPNVLLDPHTYQPTGVIDLGLLGVSDRHRDLALVSRSISSPDINRGFGPAEADRLLASVPGKVDPERLAFYRLLDEFF
jgi:aminoglycoside phosphotransferase